MIALLAFGYLILLAVMLVNNLTQLVLNERFYRLGRTFAKPTIFRLSSLLPLILIHLIITLAYEGDLYQFVWYDRLSTAGGFAGILSLIFLVYVVFKNNGNEYGPKIRNYAQVQFGELGFILAMILGNVIVPFYVIIDTIY